MGPYDFDFSQAVALLTPCGRYSYFFGCGVAGAGMEIHHDSNDASIDGSTFFFPVVQLGARLGVEVPFGDSRFGARAWGEVLYSTPAMTDTYVSTGYSWARPDISVGLTRQAQRVQDELRRSPSWGQ